MDLTEEHCLILEDDFLISEGLKLHANMAGVGRITVCGSSSAALASIEASPPTFGILDVNLGDGTDSTPVAELLSARGTPFIFLTGFGEILDADQRFRSIPLVTKPATFEELKDAIEAILPGRGDPPDDRH